MTETLMQNPELIGKILFWGTTLTIPLKGLALWMSARRAHKWWFTVLCVVYVVGIIDILYILFVARRTPITCAPVKASNQWSSATQESAKEKEKMQSPFA
ncbi:MAG: hypothetical protein KC736_01985 [Candidatus Moranbacteria bacterium]|nr:hypothetical protein [Candidatus Moranbacteria bacterium]